MTTKKPAASAADKPKKAAKPPKLNLQTRKKRLPPPAAFPEGVKPPVKHAGQFQKGQSGNPLGRPRGALDKVNRVIESERAKIADESDCTPLQFLVSSYLDDSLEHAVRARCATDALPYFHRRMPAIVEVGGQMGKQIDAASLAALSADDRLALLSLLDKLGVAL